MAPINDPFINAIPITLTPSAYPDSVVGYQQTGMDTASASPLTDPLAIRCQDYGIHGNSSSNINEYDLYYKTGFDANEGIYDLGSVWYRLDHPSSATQAGDWCLVGLSNVTLARTGSYYNNIVISVWAGPSLTMDATELTFVEASVGTQCTFYFPDPDQTVWIKVVCLRADPFGNLYNYPIAWDFTYMFERRTVGEWLESPSFTTDPALSYDSASNSVALPNTNNTSFNFVNNYASVSVDFARGFYAGGGFIGGEPSELYPQNDMMAYDCSFIWGRKLITYEAWTTLQWWTQTGGAGGDMPGDCYGVMGNTIATYDLDGIDNVELAIAIGGGSPFYDPSTLSTGNMYAGIVQDAHEDDTVGIGSEKYSSSYYGFPYLQLRWYNLLSYKPEGDAPYYPGPDDGWVDIQWEPGYATVESITVTPRQLVEANTQGQPIEVELWGKPGSIDVDTDTDFGIYEKVVGSPYWPSSQRYISGEPTRFLSGGYGAQLLGTLAEGVPMTYDMTGYSPFGTYFPAPGDGFEYAQRGQGTFQFMAAHTGMLYSRNPIPSGTWPNIYYHRLQFKLAYSITVKPPRYRYVYATSEQWLRQNQRNDHLGNRVEGRGPSTRQRTTSVNPTSSEQEGIRTTTRNWKGYR